MTCFPLYETLFQETMACHTTLFPTDDQQYISRHIVHLDDDGKEIFYAIIRQDHIASHPDSTGLPPSCRQLKAGLRVDLDKVPNHVKYMLREFVSRHLKKLQEDTLFFQQTLS